MSLLLPVVAKTRLTKNQFAQVYMCPGDKTNSIVDLTFFLDVAATNQASNFVNVYLSNTKNLTKANAKDTLFKRIPLGLPEVTPELSKIIVGKNQTLYVELVGDGPVNVRVSGLEESNQVVTSAGTVAQVVTTGSGIFELYRLDNPLATYFSGTLVATNPNATADEVYMWVTDNVEVKTLAESARLVDRVQKLLPAKDETVLVENITLAPNERIYVSSKAKGTIFNLNGLVINANI